MTGFDHRLCVAPMMEWTTRDFRYLCRLMSPHTRLYTEMVTAKAVIHGSRERLLGFHPLEHPLAVQLGGSDPHELAQAAAICAEQGFDEINLNAGCPSDRVQSGRFGACLMAEPSLVADAMAAMKEASSLPTTVKCRIGIDDKDDYDFLYRFVDQVQASGCNTFIVHARKAILKGLTPRENRNIPPLRYDRVAAIKTDFPHLTIVLNGGVSTLTEAREHLDTFDGVMMGRAIWHHPWLLSDAEPALFDAPAPFSDPFTLMQHYMPYLEERVAQGCKPAYLFRSLLNLVQGVPGARRFRRHLTEQAPRCTNPRALLNEAMALVHAG